MLVTVSSPVETYVISGIQVNMQGPSLNITFSRLLNGTEIAQVNYLLSGQAFADIFTQEVSDGLSTAIYNSALNAGVIAGTLS